LWLDDLEDLIFMITAAWERLRWRCLQMGLIAALILAGIEFAHILPEWAPALAAIATASVAIWLLVFSTVEIIVRTALRPGGRSWREPAL
jgi:hypothetical protein